MPLASDQKEGPENPSELSRRMLALQDVVLAEWERRVRASIMEAATVSHPILINTLPALYLNLVEALTPAYPRSSAAVATPSMASEHGGERARVTAYHIQGVIVEYQLLRATILDVLRENQVRIEQHEVEIISSAIDAAIREAATAFTLAHSAFREQLVATVVHDIRNPLASAHGAAQLISRLNDPDAVKYSGKILENLGRIDLMLKQVLDNLIFEHGTRLNLDFTHFDIRELARAVCRQSPDSTSGRLILVGEEIFGWWDREYLTRALENLIGNALKYGKQGTEIRVAFAESHGRLQLSVHNEGDPIPTDQTELIFQVFRRAKAVKDGQNKGWGIGLPFVRSVAECHGGSLDLDSSEERGTTFTIDIPLDGRPFQKAPTLGGLGFTGQDPSP